MNPANSRGPEDLGVQLLDNLAVMTRRMHDAIAHGSSKEMDEVGVHLMAAIRDVEARPMPTDRESRSKIREIQVGIVENLELAKAHELGIVTLLEKVKLAHR